MNRQYREKLDGLQFTTEQKQDMVQYLLDAHKEEPQMKVFKKRNKFIVLGVAAALALTAGAGAVIGGNASEWFAGVFGGAHTEIIDRIGRPVGASVTKNGLTISADAVIGDQYNACIVYTLAREDGKTFDLQPNELGYLPLHFEDQWTDVHSGFGMGGGSHGGAWFIDDDPTDNKVQFVETMSSDEPLNQGRATASFKNLCYFDDDHQESVPLVEGEWKLRFDMQYEDASVEFPAGQTFAQDGINFTITGVSLSPVALRVEYEADSMIDWGDQDSPDGRMPDEMRRQEARYFENIAILIRMKDGTVIDQTLSGGGISPKGGKTYCTKGNVFDSIVPLEDVEAVVVGGVEIPMP